MLDYQQNPAFARMRERAFWVPLISQALHHYGLSFDDPRLGAETLAAEHIDQAHCSRLWSGAVQLVEDDLFGMRLHRMFCPTPFGTLALAAQASPNISTALSQLTRFVAVVSSQVKLEGLQHGGGLELHLQPVGVVHPQHMDAIMGYIARLLIQLDQRGEELLRAATLPEHRANRLGECARLLGCQRVEAGDGYRLLINADLLDLPLATADAFLFPRLVAALQDLLASVPSDDLIEQVKRRIHLLLGSGDISEERVAGPMNISPRHLRRKLSQEGTSYEQLVDEVRRESALRMISEGQLSLTSIAYELGFLDPSSFTRAFRRWTDMSPTAFRRQVALKT